MRFFKILMYTVSMTFLFACTPEQIQQTIGVLSETTSSSVPLTSGEVAAGLKEALVQGISKGSDNASKLDGFFMNQKIKIPFPPEVEKVETRLRSLGLDSEVDKFVMQLNRGAEDAAIGAKPIFVNAIRSLTINDAFAILKGEPDAATNFLMRTTTDQLKQQFLPIIASSLDKVNATKYYGDIITKYNQIPFVQKVNPDLEDYAADRAIEGLFLLISQEEAKIRSNPADRVTDLLKKVFGSLD